MRRILTVLVAGALLVSGGVAVALLADPGSAVAQEGTTSTTEAPVETDDSAATDLVRPERGTILAGVLEDLVADGVITADQAEEITAAWQARIQELRTEFEARRGERGFGGHGDFGLRELLEDGVIDADELAELGPDHPLNDPDGPAAEFLDDGELTQDELTELHGEWRRAGRGGPLGEG